MTSRYLRLRAEQVTITPEGPPGDEAPGGARVARDCSRSRMSQSQRSASVRGWPAAIFWTLAAVWNWEGDVSLVKQRGLRCEGLTVSPSRYGSENV